MQTKIAKTGVAVGVLAVLAACGSITAENEVAYADVAFVQTQADRLRETISGSGVQQDALRYIDHVAGNEDYLACMKQSGYDIPLSFVPIWGGHVPDGTSNEWMGGFHRAPSVAALASTDAERLPERDREQTPQFNAAALECRSQDAPGLDSIPAVNPLAPPKSDELSSDLLRMVFDIDAELGPIEDYTSCMSNKGIDYTTYSNGVEGWNGLYLYLSALKPRAPAPGEKPTQDWLDYLDHETAALNADETCRSAKAAEGLSKLAGPLDAFEAAHRADLTLIKEQWADVVVLAESKGYRPAG